MLVAVTSQTIVSAAMPVIVADLGGIPSSPSQTSPTWLWGWPAMYGATFFVPLYARGVVGISVRDSGTILVPLLLSAVAVSIIVSRLVTEQDLDGSEPRERGA